jgi:hypothetical protein
MKQEDILKLLQRDIDEICEWGRCDISEVYSTLVEAKKFILEDNREVIVEIDGEKYTFDLGEKEEKESGWVIVDPEGVMLTWTIDRSSHGSWCAFRDTTHNGYSVPIDDLKEQGYTCQPAERVTRLMTRL